ncbi:NTP transferase domain-containing protein [Novosphingobium sp. CECT 9465]|uniref:nucleotidyltransferase family protein n=1 Tax=Novosphingobium sp. CECT 9465 TaxID=2829794 RepID=UPI001E423CDC|nr:nucleotidyltransferase family protein [Novosphingobium sp. CECT 9465]CAH0496917.1 hypothetical protein NVSP9465_01965 [Novosphingobium sp. CECT 9465]
MTALVLLAAGRGARFGGDKLGALLAGVPLAHHAAERLAALPFTRRLAICSPSTPFLKGFERVMLDPPGGPLSRSIAIGIAALGDQTAAMIALADMPLVPLAHFTALIDTFDGNVIASRVGDIGMPPAVFGASHFPAMRCLTGDRGAGALLRNARSIALDPALALDVDTVDDLAQAESFLASGFGIGQQTR